MRRNKPLPGRLLLSLVCPALLLCALVFAARADESQWEFHDARIMDISDRAYEPAVIKLLDGAQHSIVISMFVMKPLEKGPVRLLMRDLEEALDRGVSVEIYRNTRTTADLSITTPSQEPFRILLEKGARIYPVVPRHRLHDKVIIVDEQYVVDGSVNWSVSALKDNFESAVLIDSPELAKAKLVRLRRLPLEGQTPGDSGRPDRPKKPVTPPLAGWVTLPKELMYNEDLFPSMVTAHDSRAMDTYLLLLAEAERWAAREFFLSLENIALELKMPAKWSDTALRRQAIKVLKRLSSEYGLIDVDFLHSKDAWVALKELPPGTFRMKTDFFDADVLASRSQPAKFVLLIKALLEAEGETIDSLTREEICEEFHIGLKTLRKGLRETDDDNKGGINSSRDR